MHCLIVNHFNQKTPEKTVNRKSLVVFDIECIKSNIVKKLGVYKDGQTEGYSFLPPKKEERNILLFIPFFLFHDIAFDTFNIQNN